MRRRSSLISSRRSSTIRRRTENNLNFDEFGFALTKRKEQKLHHRAHEYSYPQLSPVRVKELCELLSYWNGASFICKSQIERFIRMGIPPSLRGRVWRCLLTADIQKETSDFNYQKCLSKVRGPLVDLGVSEYGILSAIATLSETQNDLGSNHQQQSSYLETSYTTDDITVFRQIALDLQRSFPTHRSLMGESPEAIEGQAKLFRVLIAYAKYNPQIGYCQGMSYIAAVLLMQLEEEESFWALTALLDKPKYLAEMFDISLTKVQHQVKMFDQLLKHRKPQLYQHMESAGVLSIHFVMPWFLTLFTSLPCWDSVLAVWDLIILQGLLAVFRTALTIIELLEPKLMDLTDEAALLPLLLRVPVDVAKYTVLIPALWNTEVQDWELKCMNSLVLDESHHGPKEEKCETENITLPLQENGGKGKENVPALPEGEKKTEEDSGAGVKRVLSRVMHLAQRYLLNPMSRQGVKEKSSQTQAKPKQRSPARVFRSRTSASLSRVQVTDSRDAEGDTGGEAGGGRAGEAGGDGGEEAGGGRGGEARGDVGGCRGGGRGGEARGDVGGCRGGEAGGRGGEAGGDVGGEAGGGGGEAGGDVGEEAGGGRGGEAGGDVGGEAGGDVGGEAGGGRGGEAGGDVGGCRGGEAGGGRGGEAGGDVGEEAGGGRGGEAGGDVGGCRGGEAGGGRGGEAGGDVGGEAGGGRGEAGGDVRGEAGGSQTRSRRRSQQRGRAQQAVAGGSGGDPAEAPETVTDKAAHGKDDRALKRTGTGPVGQVTHSRSKRGLLQPSRVKSLRALRSSKTLQSQTPTSSTTIPCASTPPQSPSVRSPSFRSSQREDQHDTPRTALLKELSSRHQTSFPFHDTRESKLI
ncbi:uncharacterized protein si:ch211-266k8.4 isoform X1 [Notolabrus celidotus]|uniref:uncharacterized protein si:ch211-266k8.4 isoform X1 n=1 Tax=Notolabrus celidotus TaxID=1203425 RepID=UPI00148F4B7D|nr:uncharacterized protein si:ch211-266k8.4 isoform X1 [Notolabrus celidotus]